MCYLKRLRKMELLAATLEIYADGSVTIRQTIKPPRQTRVRRNGH